MRQTTGCTMETLDGRRMLSGTLSDAFALDPSYAAYNYPNAYASNDHGTVVRSIGGGSVAIYTGLDGSAPGASVQRQLDVSGYIMAMSLNANGELAVSSSNVGPFTNGYQSEELFVRVFKIGAGSTVTPLTSSTSIAKARSHYDIGNPSVGIDGGGNVAIAWDQTVTTNSTNRDIFAKRIVRQSNGSYSAQKTLTVNTRTAGLQLDAQLALHANGAMFVGWTDAGSGTHLFAAQRFDNAGKKVASQADLFTSGGDWVAARVAPDAASGGFIAAWAHRMPGTTLSRNVVKAQRFATSLAPAGAPQELASDADATVPDNTVGSGFSTLGGISADGLGNAVVSYSRRRITSDDTTSTENGTERVRFTRYQAAARHLPAGSIALGAELDVATSYRVARKVTDASGVSTTTTSGSEVYAIAPQAYGADKFLLPYQEYMVQRTAEFESFYHARTLTPAPASSVTIFSQTTIESDESGTEELVSL